MKFWPRRRPPVLATPRANPTRIAVLEHDLFGVKPNPGTMTAAVLALRRAGTCSEHKPVDISAVGERPGTHGLCTQCGQRVTPGPDGGWAVAVP